MHVLAVPLFRDATGVAVALTAWARHRCLQLYLLLLLLLCIMKTAEMIFFQVSLMNRKFRRTAFI